MRQRPVWLIFDPLSRCWWGPRKVGRYPDILNAGLYTMDEIKQIMKEKKKDPMRLEVAIHIDEYKREIERLFDALRRRL